MAMRRLWCRIPEHVEVSTPAKVFAAAVVIEGGLLLSLAGAILADPTKLPEALVYAVMSIFSVLFWVYLGLDAVLTENRVEYWAANGASVLFSIFIAWEYAINPLGLGSIWEQLRLAALITRMTFQAMHVGLFFFVDREFGWMSYRVVGTDVTLQNMYEIYRGFASLLRVDVFTFLLLLILVGFFLRSTASFQFAIGVASAVFMVFIAIVGWWAVTYERRIFSYLFFFGSLAQPLYVGYQLYILVRNPSYLPANVTLPQFGVIGGLFIIVRLAMLYTAGRLILRFGSGLKPKLLEFSARRKTTLEGHHLHRHSNDESLFAFSDITTTNLSDGSSNIQTRLIHP